MFLGQQQFKRRKKAECPHWIVAPKVLVFIYYLLFVLRHDDVEILPFSVSNKKIWAIFLEAQRPAQVALQQ